MDFRPDEIAPGFCFNEITAYSTERLILKRVGPEEHLLLLKKNDEAQVKRFLHIIDAESWKAEKSKVEKGLSTWQFSFCNFYLFDKQNGEAIGHCGFHIWNLRHQKAELGYMIYDSANYWKGLMQEACRFVIDYGFKELKLIRIEAMTSPENEASKKILMNFGFKEEGLLKRNYIKNNQAEDSLMFGLIKERV